MRLVVAGAVVVAASLAAFVVLSSRPRFDPPPPADGSLPPGAVARIGSWEFTPITSNAGLTADGSQVIGGSCDGWVRVFDVASGREVRRFAAHTDVTESPNSGGVLRRLETGLWKSDRSRPPCDGVLRLAVSPDGTRVATAGEHVVRVFRVADGEQVAEWRHAGPYHLSWLPDGRRLVVTFGVQPDVYDVDAPEAPPVRIGSFTSGGGPAASQVVRFLAFVPNATQPPVILVTDAGAVPPKIDVPVGGPVAVRLDGQRTAALDAERKDLVVRDADGREVGRVSMSPFPGQLCTWTPDGRRLLAATVDSLLVLDADGRIERKLDLPQAWSAAFSADGRRVLLETMQGIRILDLATGAPVGATSQTVRWSLPAFADAATLVTTPGASRIVVLEARTGKLLRTLTVPTDGPWRPFVLHPSGLLGVRNSDGRFRVTDLEGREAAVPPLKSFRGTVARRADGAFVVYDPEDNALHTYPGDAVVAVSTKTSESAGTLSADSRRLFLHVKGGVAVVDTADGVTLAHLPCGDAEVGTLVPSADGAAFLAKLGNRWRVLRSDDGTVLWDSGKFDDPGPVVALSPDASLVAHADNPWTRVHVTEIATGREVTTFTGALTPFTWLIWSPDSALLSTSCLDGTVLVWDVAAARRR